MASDVEGKCAANDGSLHHVVLIGFHHKKGCVVEYAYPPLDKDETGDNGASSLPEEWKFLPSLAMPDGAHNFPEDVVYFHLPPLKSFASHDTVYGVAYCRQVDACLLRKKDEDVTRGTIQKSVVILSKVPAFGLIHAKLQLPLITNAFLENFSEKNILQELYHQINASLVVSDESHLFFGLSSGRLLSNFRHKLLVLFKLILLERRVVFYTTPASELVSTILALLSLFPRMIEVGLSECTTPHWKVQPTAMNKTDVSSSKPFQKEQNSETTEQREHRGSDDAKNFEFVQHSDCDNALNDYLSDEIVLGNLNYDASVANPPLVGQSISRGGSVVSKVAGKLGFLGLSSTSKSLQREQPKTPDGLPAFNHLDPEHDDDDAYALKFGNARLEMAVDSPEKLADTKPVSKNYDNLGKEVTSRCSYEEVALESALFKVDDYGFPLNIFTHGHLCLPYVSLQHHDLIQRCSKNGFVVGATNVLFQTRKELSDIVVDIENADINFSDPTLQKQLALSAADLRFTEHVVTNMFEEKTPGAFDSAMEWTGGDEWLRSLFAEYLSNMLCVASKAEIESKKIQDFNEAFITAWKQTKNFKIWKRGRHKLVGEEGQHPFHAQYSISDVRLRLQHRLQNSEQGRKIEDAISNANDTIINTGRFIGGAIGSAKSSLGSWLSSKLQTK